MADIFEQATALSTSVQKAKLGEEIITQTLDKFNSAGKNKKSKFGSNKMAEMYQFNRDVLDAVYLDKGSVAKGIG